MKALPLVALLAGLALLAGAGCKRAQPSPTVKPTTDPAVQRCATVKGVEECAACCTEGFNARFMGGKCECLLR